MAKIADIKEGLEFFIHALLDKEAVKGVICLRRFDQQKDKVSFSLISRTIDMSDLCPVFPFMPANGAKVVSRFTIEEAPSSPVAVVLRPCEIRALIELVKLEQAKLDNIYIIGFECLGVYPVKKTFDNSYKEYKKALEKGEIPSGIRAVCEACEHSRPLNADIVVSLIGREIPRFAFVTEKGLELAKKAGISVVEGEIYTPLSDKLLESKAEKKNELIEKIKQQIKGLSGLIDTFSRCIGCHCCSHVCPICYCKDCFFESATFDYEPISYLERIGRKGSLRVPMDTLLFQLGRMTHMATSCVACGMCEDACPVDIPVAQIFKAVGADLQELFEYIPGRDLQEAMPLTTYEIEEFHEVEE